MQAKGRAFKATIEYVGNKFGNDKLHAFFTEHPQYACIEGYHDLNWYDLDHYLRFSEDVDRHFGFGDASLLVEIGEYAAKHAFETSHRLFRDLSIESALSNAGAVFFSFYSAGSVEIKYLRNNRISLHLNGCPANPFFSKKMSGWLKQCFKHLNAKNITVREMNPAKSLSYDIEWN